MVFVLILGDEDRGIEPFLLSKYEMTQDQWRRYHNRHSWFYPGSAEDDIGATWTHPVEQVERGDVDWVMRRLGMRLPSRSQWRWAAMAGGRGRFWWGDDEALAPKMEHLPRLHDSILGTAQVGCLEPNPFGLFDVLGNVAELCRVDEEGSRSWVACGGSWETHVPERDVEGTRLFVRHENDVGLRPMIELDPRPPERDGR